MDFPEPEGLGNCVLPHVAKQEKEDLHRETKRLKIYEEARLFVVEKCQKTVAYLDLVIKTSSDQRNEASRTAWSHIIPNTHVQEHHADIGYASFEHASLDRFIINMKDWRIRLNNQFLVLLTCHLPFMSPMDTLDFRLDNIFLYMVDVAPKIRRAYDDIKTAVAEEISAVGTEDSLVDQELHSRWVAASVFEKSEIISKEREKGVELGLTEATQHDSRLQALFGVEQRAAFSKVLRQLSEDLAEIRTTLNFEE